MRMIKVKDFDFEEITYRGVSKLKPVYRCPLCSLPVIYWWNNEQLKGMGKWFHFVLDLNGSPHSCKAFYRTRKWQELKKEILSRYYIGHRAYRCPFCREPHYKNEMMVHHLVPYSVRPDWGLCVRNLVGMCVDCHKLLHLSKKQYIALIKKVGDYDDALKVSILEEFDGNWILHTVRKVYFPKRTHWFNYPIDAEIPSEPEIPIDFEVQWRKWVN